MKIENIPEDYIHQSNKNPDIFIYDFKMTKDVVNSKVNLSKNMFSFLQIGKKQVHFADKSIAVNRQQSLILKKGNWLWTELLETETIYFCKLLFFSEQKVIEFLEKHTNGDYGNKQEIGYFVIENDPFILSYLNSLTAISEIPANHSESLLSIKLEEILVYLFNKYGDEFVLFLQSLVSNEGSTLKKIVQSKVYSNLKIEEIAFLCNMSLSTFKRHFTKEFNESPGKWFQDKRLRRAKELLEQGTAKPSDLYLDFGYNNLSNFSIAFKNKFGISPTES